MIALRTLGALDLRRPDGVELHSVLAQTRRTALLVYLTLARPRGFHRRDALTGLFWPEHDSEHARNNLRQAVHFLRRSLGDEAIISRGDEDIGLGDGALSCDAVQFDAALDAGEFERALTLYAGDLLPGFFIEEAPEFDRWLEAERTRLRERAVRGCWSLAEAKERAGETAAAAEWGRRAVEIAPADDSQIMRLMQLLARAGDRSGALAAFEAYARRLRTELAVEPTVAATALAAEIRKADPRQDRTGAAAFSPAPMPAAPVQAETASPALTPALAQSATPVSTSGPPQPAAAPGPPPDHEPALRRGRLSPGAWLCGVAGMVVGIPVGLLAIGLGHALRPSATPVVEVGVLLGAAGLLLVEGGLLALLMLRRSGGSLARRPSSRIAAGSGFALGMLVTLSLAYALSPPPPPRPRPGAAGALKPDTVKRRVAVTRFANLTGDAALDPVGRLAEDWVVRRLRSIPEAEVVAVASATAADTSLDAVTALAHRTGADLVLFGSYYRDGNDLLLAASLVPPRGGRISPEITGMGIGPVRALRDRPVGAIDRLASIVAGAVAAECVLPACMPGRRAPMYEARQLYVEAFQAQARADFNLARQKYRQALQMDSTFVNAYTHLAQVSECATKDTIGEILEARRRDFGLYDLLYMRIIRASCRDDGEAIYRLRRQQLDLAPGDLSTKVGVAEAAFRSGRLREAEARFRGVLREAAAVRPPDEAVYEMLSYALHLQGKFGEELGVGLEGRRRLPEDPRTSSLGIRGLAALGRTQELEARVDEARHAGASVLSVAIMYYTAAMELEWHGQAEAAGQFALATLRELDRAAPTERAERIYLAMRANVLLELGRWQEARRLADAGKPQDAFLLAVRGLASAAAGDTADARAALAALDRLPDSGIGAPLSLEQCQASVLAALGEKEGALRRLEDAQAKHALPPSGPHITHAVSYTAAGGELLRALWHDPRFERMFAARD